MTGERRVLVVDDDHDVRQMVAMVLRAAGYAVLTAADGFAALCAVETDRPDCLVLDVRMPGLDGYAVLAQLRKGGSGLPVVMLTAAADDGQAWRAWTRGVDYFIAKPFDPEELLRYLGYLFANRATA